jgi:cytochrome b pre-mRNA-processing protein 3
MFGWLRRGPKDQAVARIYDLIVEQSRRPEFYRDLGVADSLDGRFDMLSLHAMLVMRRLKANPEGDGEIGQALFDHMFTDMDLSLREIGVGDLSVGKKVKQMSSAFLGRIAAYESGLADMNSNTELVGALIRNVYRDEAPNEAVSERLASYVRKADEALGKLPFDVIHSGEKLFADLVP